MTCSLLVRLVDAVCFPTTEPKRTSIYLYPFISPQSLEPLLFAITRTSLATVRSQSPVNQQEQHLPSSIFLFSANRFVGASSTILSARASKELTTATILPSRNGAFCNLFVSIILLPSFTSSCSSRNLTTLLWKSLTGKIRFTNPHFSSSSTVSFRPNIRKSLARWTPMLWAMLIADPFSGTNPSALNGTCRYAPSAARTISATPWNQAAPPPTPGPLRARTKTFLWSIIWRRASKAYTRGMVRIYAVINNRKSYSYLAKAWQLFAASFLRQRHRHGRKACRPRL